MSIENMIYIFAISFQLAAALMLVNNVATTRKGIIKAYCAQHTSIAFWEESNSLADYSSLKATIRSAWINKFAFSYLFIGYLISIWGEVPCNKWLALVFILILIVVLVFTPHKVAKHQSEHFGTVTIDDIPMEGAVHIETI